MVFSSLVFLFLYLTSVLLLYYIVPRPSRSLLLLIANLLFYGWGEPVFVLLMVFSTVINWALGYAIGRCRDTAPRRARTLVMLTVIIDLGLLGLFKYADMVAGWFQALPWFTSLQPLGIPLPIGISFYTFQTMSYAIDVYRGDTPVQRRLDRFGVYVTLFPQLIAGPIVRYKDVAEQLDGHRATVDQFREGIMRFVCGLAKKVLLANPMGKLFESLSALGPEAGTLGAWGAAIAYTFQIYFDFSGYSDMALGSGKMLGFEFMANFNYPYISQSVTEFWRRWHISLSTWFRDYVYIPLGGNRKGPARTYLNLLVVWSLTGLWHGASLNFVAWGLYYFLLLVAEKAFLGRWLRACPSMLRRLWTGLVVVIGWVLFSTTGSLGDALVRVGALFNANPIGVAARTQLLMNVPLLLIAGVAATPWMHRRWQAIVRQPWGVWVESVVLSAGLLLCTAALVSENYNPFLYFRF